MFLYRHTLVPTDQAKKTDTADAYAMKIEYTEAVSLIPDLHMHQTDIDICAMIYIVHIALICRSDTPDPPLALLPILLEINRINVDIV
jgi:hypothetical protein